MAELPTGVTVPKLIRLAKILTQLGNAKTWADDFKVTIRDKFKPGTYAYPGVVLTVTNKEELDKETFLADKPYENDRFKKYYKVVPDTEAIKKDFAKQYYKAGTPSVSAKLVTE